MKWRPPNVIYLQFYGPGTPKDGPVDLELATWCENEINAHDVKYVRAPKKRRVKRRPK